MGFLNFNSVPGQAAPPSLGGSGSSLGGFIPSWQVNAQPSFVGNATSSGGGGGGLFSFLGHELGNGANLLGSGASSLSRGIGLLLNRGGQTQAAAPPAAPGAVPSLFGGVSASQRAGDIQTGIQTNFQGMQDRAFSRFYRPDEPLPDGAVRVNRLSPASGGGNMGARTAYEKILGQSGYSSIPQMIATNKAIASGAIPKFTGG